MAGRIPDMTTSPPIAREQMSYDDPAYDRLLAEYRRTQPVSYAQWRDAEITSFRAGEAGAFPDQDVLSNVKEFLKAKGYEPNWPAWEALSGRLLRQLLVEFPTLHPAPGRILVTRPRTASDEQLIFLLGRFEGLHEQRFREWMDIEAAEDWDEHALLEVQREVLDFLESECWVQSSIAASSAFFDMRLLLIGRLRSN
jgi:hypothetical protein